MCSTAPATCSRGRRRADGAAAHASNGRYAGLFADYDERNRVSAEEKIWAARAKVRPQSVLKMTGPTKNPEPTRGLEPRTPSLRGKLGGPDVPGIPLCSWAFGSPVTTLRASNDTPMGHRRVTEPGRFSLLRATVEGQRYSRSVTHHVRHVSDSINVSSSVSVGLSTGRHVADSINVSDAATVYVDRMSGTATASGSAVDSVGRAKADRRSQIGVALGGGSLGGPFGEHTLHGPWLLRWGPGAALGAAVAAWLWEVLRPR
jgi:hypothetical protein